MYYPSWTWSALLQGCPGQTQMGEEGKMQILTYVPHQLQKYVQAWQTGVQAVAGMVVLKNTVWWGYEPEL